MQILGAEARLILGERKIITVLRVLVRGLFTRANLPIFQFILFGSCVNGVFVVFGIFGVLSSPVPVLLSLLRRDLERHC